MYHPIGTPDTRLSVIMTFSFHYSLVVLSNIVSHYIGTLSTLWSVTRMGFFFPFSFIILHMSLALNPILLVHQIRFDLKLGRFLSLVSCSEL